MKNIECEEISPITGNKCVMVEADEKTNVESYLCLESGYTTTDRFEIGSEASKKYESTLTELMINAKIEDKPTGLVWYPAFMRMPGGMLYCEGNTKDSLKWKVARVVPIIGDERLKYPIPGKTG